MGLYGVEWDPGVRMGLNGALGAIWCRRGPWGPYGAGWDPGVHIGLCETYGVSMAKDWTLEAVWG